MGAPYTTISVKVRIHGKLTMNNNPEVVVIVLA